MERCTSEGRALREQKTLFIVIGDHSRLRRPVTLTTPLNFLGRLWLRSPVGPVGVAAALSRSPSPRFTFPNDSHSLVSQTSLRCVQVIRSPFLVVVLGGHIGSRRFPHTARPCGLYPLVDLEAPWFAARLLRRRFFFPPRFFALSFRKQYPALRLSSHFFPGPFPFPRLFVFHSWLTKVFSWWLPQGYLLHFPFCLIESNGMAPSKPPPSSRLFCSFRFL